MQMYSWNATKEDWESVRWKIIDDDGDFHTKYI